MIPNRSPLLCFAVICSRRTPQRQSSFHLATARPLACKCEQGCVTWPARSKHEPEPWSWCKIANLASQPASSWKRLPIIRWRDCFRQPGLLVSSSYQQGLLAPPRFLPWHQKTVCQLTAAAAARLGSVSALSCRSCKANQQLVWISDALASSCRCLDGAGAETECSRHAANGTAELPTFRPE